MLNNSNPSLAVLSIGHDATWSKDLGPGCPNNSDVKDLGVRPWVGI